MATKGLRRGPGPLLSVGPLLLGLAALGRVAYYDLPHGLTKSAVLVGGGGCLMLLFSLVCLVLDFTDGRGRESRGDRARRPPPGPGRERRPDER